MRITPNITVQNSLYNIQQSRTLLDKIQEKISSGMNYNRPSDDPVSARLLIGINDKLSAGEQYNNNIKKAEINLKMTNTALAGMANYVNQAKSLASSLAGGTSDVNIRNNAINQLQAIKQQLVDMGNTQLNGVYLFGGAKSTTAPFSYGPPAVYNGDETVLNVEIGPGSIEKMNVIGNQVLMASTAVTQPYGSVNIFGAIEQLITDVTANNIAGIQTGIQTLYQGGIQLESAQSTVSSRLVRIDSALKMNDNTKNTLQTVFANVQNADYAELATELNQQKLAFEATLASTAKVTQLSLLDYL